jgi:hypothetical protein
MVLDTDDIITTNISSSIHNHDLKSGNHSSQTRSGKATRSGGLFTGSIFTRVREIFECFSSMQKRLSVDYKKFTRVVSYLSIVADRLVFFHVVYIKTRRKEKRNDATLNDADEYETDRVHENIPFIMMYSRDSRTKTNGITPRGLYTHRVQLDISI